MMLMLVMNAPRVCHDVLLGYIQGETGAGFIVGVIG